MLIVDGNGVRRIESRTGKLEPRFHAPSTKKAREHLEKHAQREREIFAMITDKNLRRSLLEEDDF